MKHIYYRFQFVNEWQTTDFGNVELQTIELCGNSFNQLTIQLTAKHQHREMTGLRQDTTVQLIHTHITYIHSEHKC